MKKEHLFMQLLRDQKPLFETINSMDLSFITKSEIKHTSWSKHAVQIENYLVDENIIFSDITFTKAYYGFTATFYTKHLELYDDSELYFGPEDVEYRDGRTIMLTGKRKYYTVQFPDRRTRLKVVQKGYTCILYFLPMRIELPD